MTKKKSLFRGREAMVFLIIIGLIIAFSLLSPSFRTYATFVSASNSMFYISLMAMGVAFPIITGGVDLSIGTGLVSYSLIGGFLVIHKGLPVGVALVVTVLLGIIIGLFNGVVIAIMDIPPFLATLCTCMITRGIGPAICGGFGVSWPSATSEQGWFRSAFKITSASGTIIPIGLAVIIVLVLIMQFVLGHTKVGRYTIAIGSNKEATRLAGVNVKFFHVFAYVISGFFAGLAGIAYAATFPTIYPGLGAGFEMDAIGGAIVGGISPSGGSGSVVGAFLGVIVITLLKVGLPYIGLEANWQQIVTGLVLIGAVLLDVKKKK